jgi:hypothetical protein
MFFIIALHSVYSELLPNNVIDIQKYIYLVRYPNK